MEWFEYNTEERIKQVYSKYTIKDFWDWWSGGEPKVMEVRIRDYALIKQLVNKYKFPYSSSGVYVNDAQQLKTVIAYVRDKATVWMGINERKKNYSPNSKWRTYSGGPRGGSSDDNINSISFVFIDIDRKTKIKPASNKELENCDILANKILERMASNGWNKSYAKICSGNGVQLLFKLDEPIKIPLRKFNSEKRCFEYSEEFERLKILVKQGIGASIRRFCKRFEDELMVEVDASALNINRVCALPATKNYKFDSFQWRGIVELETEKNVGLSDYIMSHMTNLNMFKEQNVFVKSREILDRNLIIKPGHLRENPIAKIFLDYDLPAGETNNKLWFQLKVLLRDSKFDMNGDEFREFHRDLEIKQKGRYTTNLPTKNFSFNKNTVNSFCINAGIKPIFKVLEHRNSLRNVKLEEMQWGIHKLSVETMKLDTITDIKEDMNILAKKLIEGDNNNIRVVASFTKGCIEKYGEERTKYFMENLFERYFCFR